MEIKTFRVFLQTPDNHFLREPGGENHSSRALKLST